MSAIIWQLDDTVARLHLGQLAAMVDLEQPDEGLVQVSLGPTELAGAQFLGIATASSPLSEETLSVERHVRGTDLVTAYKESAKRPVRVDALWRAVSPKLAEEFLSGVELVVSVRTNVLDSRPELVVQSAFSATETLRLVDADPVRYQPVARPSGVPMVMRPGDGLGCLLFRLPNGELSYAEMVHPADFQRDELSGSGGEGGRMRVSHRLFAERLEKGVILRARVRGFLLPRNGDAHIAAGCCAAFAAEEPPLSQ